MRSFSISRLLSFTSRFSWNTMENLNTKTKNNQVIPGTWSTITTPVVVINATRPTTVSITTRVVLPVMQRRPPEANNATAPVRPVTLKRGISFDWTVALTVAGPLPVCPSVGSCLPFAFPSSSFRGARCLYNGSAIKQFLFRRLFRDALSAGPATEGPQAAGVQRRRSNGPHGAPQQGSLARRCHGRRLLQLGTRRRRR